MIRNTYEFIWKAIQHRDHISEEFFERIKEAYAEHLCLD